jgi:plasmid stabilization system protein ParE
MGYRVELARNAERDLEDLYTWVVNRAPIQGAAWFNGLEHAILALEEMPRRYRLAREPFGANRRVRVLPYGKRPHVYRVFFTIDEAAKSVRVLHIRYGRRRVPRSVDVRP